MQIEDKRYIVRSPKDLRTFINHTKDYLWCGWNNANYDNQIIKHILQGYTGMDLYNVSQDILNQKDLGFPNVPFFSYDLMKVGFKGTGLKKIEFAYGKDINEKTEFFTKMIEAHEIPELEEYCFNDIAMTKFFYEKENTWIEVSKYLVEYFNLPTKAIGYTLGTLLTNGLKVERTREYPLEKLVVPPKYKQILPDYITQFFETTEKDRVIDVKGCIGKLSWGGYHGVCKEHVIEGNIFHLDVGSYYPTLILNNGYFTRNAPPTALARYEKCTVDRLDLKHDEPIKAYGLKLGINAAYGLHKSEISKMYDPTIANYICMHGQLSLLELCYFLPDSIKIINMNTDGVYVQGDEQLIREYGKAWAEQNNYTLDVDPVKKIIQKDVNNYIVAFENGKYKFKGGWVSQYEFGKYRNSFSPNSGVIIDTAVVDYLIKGIPVEETVFNCKDPRMFQLYAHYSKKTYKGAFVERLGRDYLGLTSRAYAWKGIDGGTIYKEEFDGRVRLMANMPKNAKIINEDVSEFDQWDNLDFGWYAAQAHARIKKFLGVK